MDLFGIPSNTWTELSALAAIVAALFAVLQTSVIIAALIYASSQTRQIRSQLRLNQISEYRQQLQSVNELLLREDMRQEAEAIGEVKQDVFAAIILNNFGALATSHQEPARFAPRMTLRRASVLTQSEAERDLRGLNIQQKVSGCFRSA